MSMDKNSEGEMDIANLQENFHKQQAKISALKELVRKSEAAHGKTTSFAQEKVKNIAQRLTHLKSKARSRQSLDRSFSEFRDAPIIEETIVPQSTHSNELPDPKTPPPFVKSRSETPGSEKVQLLRQQMEQNKLKMAERANSKREIEELVTQLKANIDITQQSLERSSELGRSMGDLSNLTNPSPVTSKFRSSTDLSFAPLNLDKEKIKFLENRIRILEKEMEQEKNTKDDTEPDERVKKLENKILDLEESLKEKECIIEARTQAVSLMSESLSAKGKNTVDMLEDTRQEMFKMQENFLHTEDALKDEIQGLKSDLDEKNKKISNLEEINDILETTRFDLTMKNAELESKTQNVQDYSTKISELNKLNETLQHRISVLETQKGDTQISEDVDLTKKVEEEFANTIKSLQDKISELEKENDDLKKLAQEYQTTESIQVSDENVVDKLQQLEATIKTENEEIGNHLATIKQLEEQLAEKTIECNVLNANFSVLQEKIKASQPKSLFSKSSDEEAEIEINKLKSQLDEANKSMIKLKLKTKQLQKQVDTFKKTSDINAELIKITDENQELQQRIAELVDEKKQLQLKLNVGDSGSNGTELEKKIQILEATCQNQTSAIQLLEEQKLDMTENLQITKEQLDTLKDQIHEIDRDETARVVSQIESIQLEEKANNYEKEIKEISNELEHCKKENEKLNEIIHDLQQEKETLTKKIDHYITENIDLLDKVEKLSKSSSSAESIEIVERLTQQEKLEIEEYNKRLENAENSSQASQHHDADDSENAAMGQELSESLVKLREESSELMHKIELFTTERREVLEKMEILTNENHEHIKKVEELTEEASSLESSLTSLRADKDDLEHKYKLILDENEELKSNVAEITQNREVLHKELNELKKENNLVSEILNKNEQSTLIKQCEECLTQLNIEVENYKKASDKNNKFNVSKKLAKEAKNVYKNFDELMKKIKSLPELSAGDVSSSSSSTDLDEYKTKYIELKTTCETLQKDLEAARLDLDRKDETISSLTREVDILKAAIPDDDDNVFASSNNDEELAELSRIRDELESKLQASMQEIYILKTLVAEQKQQLIESYTEKESESITKLEEIRSYEEEIAKLKHEISVLQENKEDSYESYKANVQKDIKKLEKILEENTNIITEQTDELRHKQETIEELNNQIINLYKTMEENSNKVIEKEDEITYLQDIIDSNKQEMLRLIKENDDNKVVVEKLLVELHSDKNKDLHETISTLQARNKELEERVAELEKLNADSEARNKEQLDKLKKFAANLKKKVLHCTELENKLKQLESANIQPVVDEAAKQSLADSQIEEYKKKLEEVTMKYEQHLQSVRNDYEVLVIARDSIKKEFESKQLALQQSIHENQIQFNQIQDLMQQIMNLQVQFGELQNIIADKDSFIQSLQQQIDLHLKEASEHEQKLKLTESDLSARNVKIEKCKVLIKEKNKEIHRLTTEKDELLQKITGLEDQISNQTSSVINKNTPELEEKYAKLQEQHTSLQQLYETEKASFQQTISRLETLHDGIQAKLQEDMGYIESLELENNNFRDKIIKLENCVASFEERRSSLERQANLLDAQLQKRTDEYERKEDDLVYRLNMLSEHDDVIGRRLLETQEEKEELSEKLERLKQTHNDILQKFTRLEKEFEKFRNDKYKNLEQENQVLNEKITTLQNDILKIQTTYEEKISNQSSEIDELENDLSIQLQKVNAEKRDIQENLERCRDEIIELKDENVRLKENVNSIEQIKNDLEREMTWVRMQNENLTQDQIELQELRMQSMQDKTEIDNLKHQLDVLIQNHDIELNGLKTQITELDSMRMEVGKNQTDDQVFIETENKRLKDTLAEKEAIIENYQKQNLQLQMTALSTEVQDPFTAIVARPLLSGVPSTSSATQSVPSSSDTELDNLREKCKKLENDISDLKRQLSEKVDYNNKLSSDLGNLQHEINRKNAEIQKIIFERQMETDSLRAEIDRLKRSQNDIASAFTTDQPASLVFEDIISSSHLIPEGQDQKKIEDLQRNVSDLEKYATDLESKLKHLASIHEDTLRQLQDKSRMLEDLDQTFKAKIQDYESQIDALKQAQKVTKEETTSSDKPDANVPSLNMFFDNPTQPASQFDVLIDPSYSGTPVVEEEIVPKKAYLCYPDAKIDFDNKSDAGEGWGLGVDDVDLEEKHYQTTYSGNTSLLPPDQKLEIKLQESQDRIKELELERDRLDEQRLELQVKSGKLMKKLKEYKAQISQLNSQNSFRKSSSVESNDLDLAIQEELKSQVKNLEEKLIEMKKQFAKEQAEKENMLKRIDVLTAANERFTEMKERQDIEIEVQQTKVRQLTQQIKNLEEWGDQPAAKQESVSQKVTQEACKDDVETKYLEIVRELEDLKVDRDELQAMLDEEKSNSKIIEEKYEALKSEASSSTQEQASNTELIKSLQLENQVLKTELNDLKIRNQNLQSQLADYQSTMEQLSNESSIIKSHVDVLRDDHQRKIDENLKLSNELQSWIEKSNNLAKEVENMRQESKISSDATEYKEKLEQENQELNAQLQYKNAEILHLNQTIEDIKKEDQTEHLVQEILAKNTEINQLREKVKHLETEKSELENNLSIQITRDMSQRNTDTTASETQQEKINELLQVIKEVNAEKEHMENELQVLNNHVLSSLQLEDKMKQIVLELDTKNIEIAELKKSLEVFKSQEADHNKQSESPSNNTTLSDENLAKLNEHWEAIVEQRCGEVAESWRQHLNQKELEYKTKEENFMHEIQQLTESINDDNKPTNIADNNPSNKTTNEDAIDSETFENMRAALESQELEIVTLKEQLAMRSAEYARLAAQHDPYAQSTTSGSVFDIKVLHRKSSNTTTAEQSSLVPKSELDIALYMLHQRDMRCEELTLELVNLLAERDTLQLKLSHSLRQVEEIRCKTGYTESGSDSDQGGPSTTHTPEKPNLRPIQHSSEEENTKEPSHLNAKISEIHAVNQARNNKMIWEDRDQRQRQMERIQEDVANIPSEAVSELMGAEYSNTSQSPSAALLSWLWGKTTGDSQ